MVIKIPDSTFSFWVKKFESRDPLREFLNSSLKRSELLLAQEFLYTPFDWRVGILDGEPLFVCKYEMAPDHWQIYNWDATAKAKQEGGSCTLSVKDAPGEVVRLATDAARLLGCGLFGVDLKQVGNRTVIIEVNENPNIDAGIEDLVLGDELYLKVLMALRTRIEKRVTSGGPR
jgi:glutathione synthase/RimK-type ligase-like ATP-grasp enzyme